MENEIRLVKVYSTEIVVLKEYIEALYRHDEQFEALVHIEEGIRSLFKNEALATPYFIKRGEERLGYVILNRYHSVEKGGLTIFIDELYVEDQFRRAGVGRDILAKIGEIARSQGAKTLWANTEPVNDAAQEFFSSQGFRPNASKHFERPI